MHRRRLLAGLSSIGAFTVRPALAFSETPPGRPPTVVVVGAGVMGASVAYHLCALGAKVIVLEQARPGGGATQGAFASLIPMHEDGPRALNDLYGAAVLDWRRLEMELGGALQVQWGGALTWTDQEAAAADLRARAARAAAWGVAYQTVGPADFARLAPGVIPGPISAGVFIPSMGTVDPLEAVKALLDAAQSLGAEVRFPCRVVGMEMGQGGVRTVQTTGGDVQADVVVVAAGAESDRLARMVGAQAPHTLVSGTLAHSTPHRRVLHRVLNGPSGSVKQNPDGRIVTGLDYRPGAAGADVSQEYGEKLLAVAARIVPDAADAKLEKMTLGYVPIPKDTQPIVGFCNHPANVYLMLMMSGVTLSPMMGRFAAAEIVSGLTVEPLSPFRPSRFT